MYYFTPALYFLRQLRAFLKFENTYIYTVVYSKKIAASIGTKQSTYIRLWNSVYGFLFHDSVFYSKINNL